MLVKQLVKALILSESQQKQFSHHILIDECVRSPNKGRLGFRSAECELDVCGPCRCHCPVDIVGPIHSIGAELERIIEDELRDPSRIGVVTIRGEDRNQLRRRLQLVAWDDRGDGAVVCETYRRAKGLEFDTVILVAPEPEDASAVTPLYIGVSRAVAELIVVGSPAVADRLGIA